VIAARVPAQAGTVSAIPPLLRSNTVNIHEGKTKQQLRAEAFFVQDAVNLRAIARLLVAAADRAADQDGGTEASYNDAAVILIVNKIESLVNSADHARFHNALEACRKAYAVD